VPYGEVFYEDGEVAAVIHGLAICQYEGSVDVYRFSCSAHWECEQDQVYSSVELAKSQLPEQYRKMEAVWQRAA
jgi:hypothetical protein